MEYQSIIKNCNTIYFLSDQDFLSILNINNIIPKSNKNTKFYLYDKDKWETYKNCNE